MTIIRYQTDSKTIDIWSQQNVSFQRWHISLLISNSFSPKWETHRFVWGTIKHRITHTCITQCLFNIYWPFLHISAFAGSFSFSPSFILLSLLVTFFLTQRSLVKERNGFDWYFQWSHWITWLKRDWKMKFEKQTLASFDGELSSWYLLIVLRLCVWLSLWPFSKWDIRYDNFDELKRQ